MTISEMVSCAKPVVMVTPEIQHGQSATLGPHIYHKDNSMRNINTIHCHGIIHNISIVSLAQGGGGKV